MSRIVPSSILTALAQPEVQPFYAVEFSFDSGTIRFWTGYGDREIAGQTYIGTGNLLTISGMEEAADMSAKSSTVSMSGIPGALVSLALQEPYQNRPCRILFGCSVAAGSDWILSSGFWSDLGFWRDEAVWTDDGTQLYNSVDVFSGFMDKMSIDDGGDTATITLSVESKWVKLDRVNARRYTSESQKSRYPTDTFFDYVSDLQDKDIAWGRQNA